MNQRAQEYSEATGNYELSLEDINSNLSLRERFRDWVDKKRLQEMLGLFAEVSSLNPEAIREMHFDPNNISELYDVIHGMISGISPRDINYYMHEYNKDPEQEAKRIKMESAILHRLRRQASNTIGWIASPSSLAMIEERLAERDLNSSRETDVNLLAPDIGESQRQRGR